MSYYPLSRLSKDYLNQDPEYVSKRQMSRLAWSRSSISSHPRRQRRTLLTLGRVLGAMRDLIEEQSPSFEIHSPPRLKKPLERANVTYRLPRYFSKGALDNDLRKNPTPIPYLLTETNEISKARLVPGNSLLLRSLCKGKGTLRQNKQGLIYLDIDNRFISSLIPYLKAYGLVRPPYFNLFGSPDGAHVPVIPAREMKFQYLDTIAELGQEFSFEIEGLYSIEPSIWPEVSQVWFFKLKSPDLERLRRRHFLPATPGGHSFHIAVAVKPNLTFSRTPPFLPTMRINVAFLAA